MSLADNPGPLDHRTARNHGRDRVVDPARHPIGRKNMSMIGCVTMGIFGFVYFALLNTGVPA